MTAILFLIVTQSGGDTIYNLRDFRIPEDGISSLALNGALSLDNEIISYTNEDTLMPDSRRWTNSYGNSIASLKWDLNVNGERRFLHISISPNFMCCLNNSTRQLGPDSMEHWSSFSGAAGANGYFYGGWYFAESPWFIGGKARFSAHGGFEYYHPLDTFRPYFPDPRCEVLTSAGLGKVRNVASAARAWLFLEENGAASYYNIQQLASILSKEWKYKIKYWRYQKYFYEDVDSVLLGENSQNGLTSYQLMRLREIVENTSQFERQSGNRLSIMSGLNYNDYDRDDAGLEPEVVLSFLGGYPISRRWQVSYSTENSIYFPLYTYVGGYRPDAKSFSGVSLSYYIGDS